MQANDLSHLDAINERLAHAKSRSASATRPRDKAWLDHEIQMIERERESEIQFLAKRGIVVREMTVDELLAELDQLGS